MTSRSAMEKVLDEVYRARVTGDVAAIMRHFSDDAHFELKGSPAASQVPLRCASRDEIAASLQALVDAVHFTRHEITHLVIDGETAAVQTRVHMRSTRGGDEHETAMADFVAFREGRITSFVQFVDTALAAKLI